MVVGLCTMELHLPGIRSLKGKRRIVRSAIDRIKAHYNVSVAEVGHQDTWQRATLGVACVSSESAHVQQVLMAVVRLVEGCHDAELVDYTIGMV